MIILGLTPEHAALTVERQRMCFQLVRSTTNARKPSTPATTCFKMKAFPVSVPAAQRARCPQHSATPHNAEDGLYSMELGREIGMLASIGAFPALRGWSPRLPARDLVPPTSLAALCFITKKTLPIINVVCCASSSELSALPRRQRTSTTNHRPCRSPCGSSHSLQAGTCAATTDPS
jgi:hypothetical protein